MAFDVILAGWLHKKRREERKAILGSKYQKRWFELTEDTLAYAKDPNELKDTRIEVFCLPDLRAMKRLDELKIQMQFPGRVLRVKAETPGEATRWHQELDRLMRQHQQTRQSVEAYTPPPCTVKKAPTIATALTIEAESDDDDDESIKPNWRSSKSQQANQKNKSNRLSPAELHITPPTEQDKAQDNRPPSPRSLLANPKLGSRVVSSPVAQTTDVEDFRSSGRNSPSSHWQEDRAPAPVQLSESELPRPAFLSTSLRSNVLIQDELAPALRCASPASSTPTDVPSPMSSSIRASTPSKLAPPREEEVLLFDDDYQSIIGARSVTPSSTLGRTTSSSRPVSGGSSTRVSAVRSDLDERLELQLPAPGGASFARAPPQQPSSRLHSASSTYGAATPSSAARLSSANSSLRVGTIASTQSSAEVDSGWIEEDWDSSAEENDDHDPALAHKQAPQPKQLASKGQRMAVAPPVQVQPKGRHKQELQNCWDNDVAAQGDDHTEVCEFQQDEVFVVQAQSPAPPSKVRAAYQDTRHRTQVLQHTEPAGSTDAGWVEEDWDADD